MRQRENQKVSLKLYREESRKIQKVLQRFSENVEKASCDEAYIDVTQQVNIRYTLSRESCDEKWCESKFMGFAKGEGGFLPQTMTDIKLWMANEIAAQIRKSIFDELGYTASAGISHNKTMAKIACSDNKPNGQSVVPERYYLRALKDV
jgi:nucleotidyltransferase/DNA polymerase involved in DNA repair